MANSKITALTADTSPTSDDLIVTVDSPAGTPANKKVTLGDAITKAHGLSAGLVKAATGAMSVVTAPTGAVVGTSDSQALTNKDLSGAGNTFPTFNQDTTGKSAKTDALNSATTVVNVAAATAPSANQVLTATDSTHATWVTPTGGGQTLFEAIVAPSGGDYTTIGAAVTAGKTRIFVRNGTYSESSVTCNTANMHICGESMEGVVVAYTSNANTFIWQSDYGILENIKFTQSSANSGGGLQMSSCTGTTLRNIHAVGTGSNSLVFVSAGTNTMIVNCIFDFQGTGGTDGRISFTGTNVSIIGCSMLAKIPSTGGRALINFPGQVNVTDCYLQAVNGASSAASSFTASSDGSTFTGNLFTSSVTANNLSLSIACSNTAVTGNYFKNFGGGISTTGSFNSITGNTLISTSITTPNGISLGAADNVVSGNTLLGRTTTLAGTGVTVSAGDDNVVTGNRIKGWGTGLSISAGINRTVISGNAYNGNTAGLTDAGTGTVTTGNST